MTVRDQLLREIEAAPDDLLTELLQVCRSLKQGQSSPTTATPSLTMPEDAMPSQYPFPVFRLGVKEEALNREKIHEADTNILKEVLEFFATLPTLEEILTLSPSAIFQSQIDRLSEKYQAQELTPQEEQLWQQYEYLEHIISIAKAKAYLKLQIEES